MTPASDAAVALLPCPFCGGEAKLSARAASSADGGGFLAFAACYCGGFSATAHQMGRGTTEADAKHDAVRAWNRRTPALDAAARTGVDRVEVTDAMVDAALAAQVSFYENPENAGTCNQCNGTGQWGGDWCDGCGGAGIIFTGTDRDEMRAAIRAAIAAATDGGEG